MPNALSKKLVIDQVVHVDSFLVLRELKYSGGRVSKTIIDKPDRKPRKNGSVIMIATIRKDFIFGVLVILPVAIILWLIDISIRILTGPVSQLFGIEMNSNGGLIFSLLFIWGIGAAVRYLVSLDPFLFVLKRSSKKYLYYGWSIDRSDKLPAWSLTKKQRFLATVFVEYPSKGIWSLGFLTNDAVDEMKSTQGMTLVRNPVAVFIPSTPNPTNGIFVFVEESQVHQSTMTVEDGIKCLMSAGMITPKERS